MIIDFRQADRKEIDATLCIVGAGAAGITLGRALAGSGIPVCILESGGLEYDERIQELYDGKDAGFHDIYDLKNSRLRYFGGSTNHWVGHCAPATDLDFAPRPWVPYSGWPLTKAELDPYYEAAQHLLEIGAYRYALSDFPDRYAKIPPFDPNKIVTRVWRLSPPTRFGVKYRDDLARADNVRVYLHANVVDFDTDADAKRVTAARLHTLDGERARVRAKYFVLACGGIENARLLLLSNRHAPRGLGNAHDVVGRYYIDQLRVENAAVAAVDNEQPLTMLEGDFHRDGVRFSSLLCPSEQAQRERQTLNWAVEVSRLTDMHPWAVALRNVRDAWREGKWPDDFGKQVWAVISDLDGVATGMYRRLQPWPLSLLARCEVAPDPENRVVLSGERDALGQNKIERRWRLGPREKHTIRTATRIIGEELGRLGLGRVKLADWLLADDNRWPADVIAGPHHSGTTRMASDPRRGVVDATCRVHGVENLYVAGSSVFPAGGYTHPTLTVVALALRLADHLRHRLEEPITIKTPLRSPTSSAGVS